jgi:hypothetical protein
MRFTAACTLLVVPLIASACEGASTYDTAGVVRDGNGLSLENILVSCTVVALAPGQTETLDDVDFTHAVATRTSADGSYWCGDVPAEMLLPDPLPGRDLRDLALAFSDTDGAENGGTFGRFETFVLRVRIEETRELDVVLSAHKN